MFSARLFAAALPALSLMAGALLAPLGATTAAYAQDASGNCAQQAGIVVLPSPIAPWTGAPLRVVLAAEKPLAGELTLIAPDGHTAASSRERHGGPPYFWLAEVASPAAGTWRATLTGSPCGSITREIAVRGERPAPPHATPGSVWPLRDSWSRGNEDLYSAWIETLFDAPVNVELSWPALDKVLHDRSRNFLFNHLGLGEDQTGMVMRPDCADLPYFLRAYFAFKMRLPFGFSQCSRGSGGKPPKCYAWLNAVGAAAAKQPGLSAAFGQYLKVVGDGVQSGNGRTLARDDNSDFYPVPLTQDALRPGTIYADPYGHILTLVRRVPQSGSAAGVFLAVDAEPDGSVTRKRFWRGNFLFVNDPALGSPGFKRFRPIMRDKSGAMRRLSNRELASNPQYADFSLDQSRLGMEAFYDRMDDVMSPAPLDPVLAMKAAITALEEQVQTRVTAVENGRKYQNAHAGEVGMPDGAAIFATNGPWEDFSTPARDFRLLIAVDVVRGFPERVARRPERYAIPEGRDVAQVKAELQSVLASELASRKFSYKRSDGSAWTLSLKDVLDRAVDFEMAYNPNDCAELRWGAADNSAEASTCKRRAPKTQRSKMSKYRSWFQQRHWPLQT